MDEYGILGWYTTSQRTLIPLGPEFHYPRSLQRALNQNRFEMRINQDFAGVVRGCSQREVTWISQELIEIYFALHATGWAHSYEAWYKGQLAGGILGIVMGGMFIGESMFYQVSDASKVALVKLVEHLRRQNFLLFDAQLDNPHLSRFGSYTVSDREYQALLAQALQRPCEFIPGQAAQSLGFLSKS